MFKSVSDLIKDATLSTGAPSNASLLDDATLLRYFNNVHREVCNNITQKVDADYFKGNYKKDLYTSISKYRIRDNSFSFKDIDEVAIRTGVDGEYRVIYEKEKEMTPYWDEERDYGYHYDIVGDFIELYPTPAIDIPNGLAIRATINIADLAQTDGDDKIFAGYSELLGYQNVLVEGLRFWIFRIMENTNEANVAKQYYDSALNDMLNSIGARTDELLIQDRLSRLPNI